MPEFRSAFARARLLAPVLLAVLAAGCADFLAAPAHGPAQLSLSYSPGGGTPPGAAAAFEQVDELHVSLARGTVAVMDTSFTVSPGDTVLRQAFRVELEEPEEEMALAVELRWQGSPRFMGSTTVRLVRGARNAVEVTLQPAESTGALVVDVANAVTGQPLSGATVAVRAGANAPATDPVVDAQVTGTAGTVRFATLPAGAYTLFVSAPAMITAVVPDVTVSADEEAVQRVALSPVLSAGETRIVLTWAAEPSDLDSHLTGPDGAGGQFHVYYRNETSQAPLSPTLDVVLDTDDTSGFGPETITIHRQFAGTYCYSVHNFTGGTGLGASGAQVKVFRGSQQVATYMVPATTERVWTVFRISGSTVTPVNTTGDTEPGVCP